MNYYNLYEKGLDVFHVDNKSFLYNYWKPFSENLQKRILGKPSKFGAFYHLWSNPGVDYHIPYSYFEDDKSRIKKISFSC